MNFPQFWARGQSGGFFAWRWSAKNMADAQALANQAAQQLAERFRSLRAGELPPKSGGYYPNRPFCEQILQEIKNPAGEITAVVTRNSYGCQVLNTAKVMFVDIDLPEPKSPGLFQRLFGKPSPPPVTLESVLAKIETWTHQHPDWGWRIYKTRAGLRLLATQALVDADSKVATDIFEALGSDPLYRHLCVAQKCYRARLTPKPWRCGLRRKPDRWPWLDAKAETRFQRWDAQYRTNSASWATCQLIRQIGNATVHPEVQTIIKLHDTATRVNENLQLA
ncbi:MAG TPA: hypothetical protein VK742_15865 [Candidatus Sulfotelmatobacter sp.]|jgi:hypothetical protein|nr:hypothetical protein [Candidatus Sulfotelmatobacter sp.]